MSIEGAFNHFEQIMRDREVDRGIRAQQSLAATAAELQKANGMFYDEAAKGWLWSSRAKAYEELLAELQSRYPNDPLFQKIGGVHTNGKQKMVLHQKIEAVFNEHFKPDGVVRVRALALLNQFLKLRPY